MAEPRGVKTWQNRNDSEKFVVISYSIHSLMHFDERVERLLSEIDGHDWDLFVLQETWRADACETLITSHGHLWYGSGGMRGQRGVGFLLHKKWKDNVCIFKPISERLGFLDIVISEGSTVRFFNIHATL